MSLYASKQGNRILQNGQAYTNLIVEDEAKDFKCRIITIPSMYNQRAKVAGNWLSIRKWICNTQK